MGTTKSTENVKRQISWLELEKLEKSRRRKGSNEPQRKEHLLTLMLLTTKKELWTVYWKLWKQDRPLTESKNENELLEQPEVSNNYKVWIHSYVYIIIKIILTLSLLKILINFNIVSAERRAQLNRSRSRGPNGFNPSQTRDIV